MSSERRNRSQDTVIPVVREELHVRKRKREAGQVVVHVTPRVKSQRAGATLAGEQLQVQRVPINRQVDAPQPPRQEGNVTIVPIYEEILVTRKQLVLKEEIRITRRKTTRRESRQVSLRVEEVHILRAEGPPD
jgi:stress response protein YsnF